MNIDDCIDEILQRHFPNPPASIDEIRAFEEKNGWTLDADLRAFYKRCNGASLFRRPNSTYRILALSEVVRARVAVFGKDDDSRGPRSWFAICDNQDGDYVAIDIAATQEGKYSLFDVGHETFPDMAYAERVAASFAQFLEKALSSSNRRYWLSG